jgi:hypothetical protein
MLTYHEATDLMETARDADKGKPLANNTRLYFRDGDYSSPAFDVVLHETAIVTIDMEHGPAAYTIRTGGWNTVTTRERLNRYAPGHFFTKEGVLYVRAFVHSGSDHVEKEVPVREGMVIMGTGRILDYDEEAAEAWLQAYKAQKTRVNGYVRDYMAALADRLPAPSGGDCWYCCMISQDGKPLGDHTDHSHIEDHISEGYYVPSLLVNALKERGVRPEVMGVWLDFDGDSIGCRPGDTLLVGALRRYLQRRVLPGTMQEGHIPLAGSVNA